MVVTKHYEGSDKEEELETVLVVINNNNLKVVSESYANLGDDDFENDDKNFFDKDIDYQVKAAPQTTVNTKVVQAMKKLQALYNDDANKIVKQTTQEKSSIKNLDFLIDLAMVTTGTKPAPEEPKIFTKTRNHPSANSHAKWQEAIKKEFADMNKQQV